MKSPNGKSKIHSCKRITKCCKDCSKQVPTACKACSCGYRFRKLVPPVTVPTEPVTAVTEGTADPAAETTSGAAPSTEMVRTQRAQRTRRERPHFFDSLEYGTHIRRKRAPSADSVVLGSSASPKVRRSASIASQNSTSSKSPAPKHKIGSKTIKCHPSTTSSSTSCSASDATLPALPADVTVATVAPRDCGANAGGSSSSCSSRDDDIHGVLSSEKALRYSIILAEINRKYSAVTFRPS